MALHSSLNKIGENSASADKLIVVLKVFSGLIIVAGISLVFRSNQFVTDHPLSEDGYYSFTVARNISMGKGLTIDGVMPTNGFQPLFTVLSVPAFWLSGEDKLLAIRWVMLLHWIFHTGTAFILGAILRSFIKEINGANANMAFWLAAVSYLASIFVFTQHYNGLETGFLLFLTALAWMFYQKAEKSNRVDLVKLGALLGLVVLARIDAVFLVIITSTFLFLYNDNKASLVQRATRFITVGSVAFLVSSPWWLYNLLQFGSLMPTSGKAQQEWIFSTDRIWKALQALSQELMPLIYTGRFSENLGFMVRGSLAVALVVFTLKQLSRASFERESTSSKTVQFGGFILLSGTILAIWYTASSPSSYFYMRYFSPLAIVATGAISYLLVTASDKVVKASIVMLSGFSILMLITIAFMHMRIIFLGNPWHDNQVMLVKKLVPKGELVAAGQTGNLGYFCENVVNLDGKVNHEALKYQKNMREYLDQKHIYWLCDWPNYIKRYLGDEPEKHGWVKVAEQNNFFLYHKISPK